MSLSWKLGRVWGIDVFVHWTLMLLGVIALSRVGAAAALFYAAFFGCILLHELGHALAARRYRIRTEDITLYPIGGVARLHRLPRAAGPELAIALAGPAVNVAIALGMGALLVLGRALGGRGPAWIDSMMRLNLGLALFNLIPAFPMDGGRVLRALLSGRLGRLRATEWAARLGQWLALAFGLVGLASGWAGLPHVLLAAFVFLAARAELSQVRDEDHRDDRDREGSRDAPRGHWWIYRGNGVWQLAPVGVGPDDRFGPRGWGLRS